MNKPLPMLTTMMLDALIGTLPRLPQNNRAAAVCRCVFSVYSATHGARAPWEITGETAEECEERIKAQPVTIIDTTAEVIDESTRAYETNRPRRYVEVSSGRMRRRGTIPRTNGKRVQTPHDSD